MAKRPLNVDRKALVQALAKAEEGGPLSNLNLLWNKAAELYNLMAVPEKISFSVVALRVKDWKLEVQTKPGKRGGGLTAEARAAGQAARRGTRTSRADKFSQNPTVVAGFKELKKNVPERWQPLVQRAMAGSMKAAVNLNCLDCSGFQTAEIRNCVCTYCPLYAFRPYQGKTDNDEENDADVEEVEIEEVESAA